jgi:hypothetical protein
MSHPNVLGDAYEVENPSLAAPSFLGAVFVVECRRWKFVASKQPLPGGSTHLGIDAFLCPPGDPVGGKGDLIIASQLCDLRPQRFVFFPKDHPFRSSGVSFTLYGLQRPMRLLMESTSLCLELFILGGVLLLSLSYQTHVIFLQLTYLSKKFSLVMLQKSTFLLQMSTLCSEIANGLV